VSGTGTLVLAWGNPGRRDDGLGPAFAAALAERATPGVVVETDYQLQVEDAETLARHDRVLFVDADRAAEEPFQVRRLEPEPGGVGFTSHSVSPGRLLALGRDLFGARPEAWLMGIRGYEFDEFGEGLSPRARTNLELAVGFAHDFFARRPAGPGMPPPPAVAGDGQPATRE